MSGHEVARLEEIQEITNGRRARARTRAFPRMRLTSFVVEATIPTPVDIDGNEGQ
jgi:hypothetical protein